MYYCACGKKGRGIGLITSKPIAEPKPSQSSPPKKS
jgi:hypothetical protein